MNFRGKIILTICLISFFIIKAVLADNQTYSVSLVHLLTEPADYEGLEVEVGGFLKDEINLKLYLTKEHAVASDSLSSVLVSDTKQGDILQSSCLSSFVFVTGIFEKIVNQPGYLIKDIEHIYQPKSGKVCWSRSQD